MHIRLLAVVAAYVAAYYLASFFGSTYASSFPAIVGGGSFIPSEATQWLAGLPLAAAFFVVFVLTCIGSRNQWLWIGVASLPAALLAIIIDPRHIYFPIILGLIAWGLGTVANKTLRKFAPAFMARIS